MRKPRADRQAGWWSRTAADRIERTDGTVPPPAGVPECDLAPDYHVWDTWPIRT